jgi:branched-subunit amino acid aminotransferase/4-amino-4-deoxychorismate lyase
MLGWVWNGREFAAVDSVPLTDRGFRYGMSLFESIAVEDGVVEFWSEHLQRLMTVCIERDFFVDEGALREAEGVLQSAGHNGFGRIYVTAGDGGPAAPIEAPRVFVFLDERERTRDESWTLGFHEDTWQPLFAGLKTGNYWPNCDALASARRRGFEEALLFNDHAELVSACCANVFLVIDEQILTPSRGSGCRLGVVREWVIKRRKVEERRIRREDVLKADEIFLTNSWMGVMPIATLEGRPLGPVRVASRLIGEWERGRIG